jgi:hypothetical protein
MEHLVREKLNEVFENPHDIEVNEHTTWEEYYDFKINKARETAHANSLNRTSPSVPIIGYESDPNSGERITNYGGSCLYTALDNYYKSGYGKKVAGNQEFLGDPQSFGFEPLKENEKSLPGYVVQIFNIKNVPTHAMIYDSTDGNGDRFNYSDGGSYNNAMKKRGYYPLDGSTIMYYKYVGTPEEQKKWENEYVEKKKEWFRKNPVNSIKRPPLDIPKSNSKITSLK